MKDPREEQYEIWSRRECSLCPQADRLNTQVGLNLVFTRQILENYMNGLALEYGVSLSAMNVLSILNHQEDLCAPLHEIGRLLITSRANVTGLIDGLAAKGYLERIPHPSDRRIKLARLLPPGQELLARFLPAKHERLKEALATLSDPEKTTLIELLSRVREALSHDS